MPWLRDYYQVAKFQSLKAVENIPKIQWGNWLGCNPTCCDVFSLKSKGVSEPHSGQCFGSSAVTNRTAVFPFSFQDDVSFVFHYQLMSRG